MPRWVTYASMSATNGTVATLTVYRAQLRGRKRQYIDLSAPGTAVVAAVKVTERPLPYRAIAEQYATPDYPAFDWGDYDA